MVAQLIDNYEHKCESFYAFEDLVTDEWGQHNFDNKKEQSDDVDCRMVELDLHRHLYKMPHTDGKRLRTSRWQWLIWYDFSMLRGSGSACMIGLNTIDWEMLGSNS